MKCIICGKEFNKPQYMGDYKDVCSSECFGKLFWKQIVDNKESHIFINGECYFVGDENSTSSFRGCGGSKFTILKNNGEKVVTTNLWCQGKVPEEFRDQLPDNAKFIRNL